MDTGGRFSVTHVKKTTYERRTVKEYPIFSPDSMGKAKTAFINMEFKTMGIIWRQNILFSICIASHLIEIKP